MKGSGLTHQTSTGSSHDETANAWLNKFSALKGTTNGGSVFSSRLERAENNSRVIIA